MTLASHRHLSKVADSPMGTSQVPMHYRVKIRSIGMGAVVCASLATGYLGCHRAPETKGMSEWTPSDHDTLAEKDKGQPGGQPGDPAVNAAELVQLVTPLWVRDCSSCHGATGRGDGDAGGQKVADFSSPDWQAKRSDQEIVQAIRAAGTKYHSFEAMPEVAARALAAKIRSFRR
jgi:hypothetical protein